jgi:hypothetical protein
VVAAAAVAVESAGAAVEATLAGVVAAEYPKQSWSFAG